MEKGYKRIFIGLIFLSFHFNGENIQLLPNWLSYGIILSGVYQLAKASKLIAFEKCKSILWMSLIGNLFLDISCALQLTIINNVYSFVYTSIMLIIELLWIYYLFEGTIEALELAQQYDESHNICKKQKCYVIVQAVTSVMIILVSVLQLEAGIMGLIILASLLVRISIIVTVYYLSKGSYENKAEIIF